MICPSCGKLISVNEPRCPFCGAWRPGMYGFAPRLQRFFGGRLNIVSSITVACVILYGLSIVLDPSQLLHPAGGFLNFLSPGGRGLLELGMTGGYVWTMGWWWTIFTAIYLHGGLLHIFFNMISLRNLGPAVENVFGPARTFVIFSIAGAVGFLLSDLTSGHPSIGASGSIFGLLAALMVYGRRRHIHTLTAQLGQWAVIMFAMGFFLQGVNNWAHAGGFAGGWVTATLMRFDDEKRESPRVQVLALAFILVTVAGFVLSFMKAPALLSGE